MPVKTWDFELDGGQYNVVLDHTLFMGQLSVRVNGGLLFSGLQPNGGRHAFRVGEHICEVVVDLRGDTFAYTLLIDGTPHGPETLAHKPGEAQAQKLWMSWVVPLAALALAVGGQLLNMYLSSNNGYFYRWLAILVPPGIIFGLYTFLFPDEFIGSKATISLRFLALMFIGFLIGLVNWYAMANGWY
jgi:hypothetical protein